VSFPDVVIVGRTSQVNCMPRSVQGKTADGRSRPGLGDRRSDPGLAARTQSRLLASLSSHVVILRRCAQCDSAPWLSLSLSAPADTPIREIIAASSATESEVSAQATMRTHVLGCGGEIGRSGPGLMIETRFVRSTAGQCPHAGRAGQANARSDWRCGRGGAQWFANPAEVPGAIFSFPDDHTGRRCHVKEYARYPCAGPGWCKVHALSL
jgi:hypothetical protein